MKKFEFLGYKPIQNNQYMTGLVSIRMYYFKEMINNVPQFARQTVVFKESKRDDGGLYYSLNNYTEIDADTQKKNYIKAYRLDSTDDTDELDQLIRESVRRAKSPTQQSYSAKEVAADEHVPF